MEDFPTELINFVTDNLRDAGDLAALARTNRRLNHVVDPVLYKFAKTTMDGNDSWHPLRWAAENGQTGTIRKALAAGIDANMSINVGIDRMTRDLRSFQIRVEAIDGKAIWDPPQWDPTEEWRPADGETDHDPVGRPMIERNEYALARDSFHNMRPISDLDEESNADSAHVSDGRLDHPLQYAGSDAGPMSEASEGFDFDAYIADTEEADNAMARARGFCALHLAARGGYDDAVLVLLEHGADMELCSGQLCNCESGCARSNSSFHGVPLNRTQIAGFSPLHLAICHFQAFTAKLLLSQGASVRLSEPGRDSAATALHDAAGTGQTDLCKHLLDHGYVSEVDVLDSSGLTPFYYACFNGHWHTTVAFLLERGADIDFLIPHFKRSDPLVSTPFSTILFEACAYGRYEDALKLIHLGADVSKGTYRDGRQLLWPLHAVCHPPKNFDEPPRHLPMKLSGGADKKENKRVEVIEAILRKGADIEVKSDVEGESPLHFAAKYDIDIGTALRALLAAGANVESRK